MPSLEVRLLGVGVGTLLATELGDDVDEASVVLHASLGSPGLLLLLLGGLHLWRLSLDLASASKRPVHLASEQASFQLDGAELRRVVGQQGAAIEGLSPEEHGEIGGGQTLALRHLVDDLRDGLRAGQLERVQLLTSYEQLHDGR
jgi:hypothetical protein